MFTTILNSLDEQSNALATTDACGSHGPLQVPALQLVHQVSSDARSRRGQRMTQCNSTSVDIQLVHVQFQGICTSQRLNTKGLVDLSGRIIMPRNAQERERSDTLAMKGNPFLLEPNYYITAREYVPQSDRCWTTSRLPPSRHSQWLELVQCPWSLAERPRWRRRPDGPTVSGCTLSRQPRTPELRPRLHHRLPITDVAFIY